MAAPKKYKATKNALMGWAKSELEHVGRIAAVEDQDIQYSYALSTVNGMAHLKDALFEMVEETEEDHHKRDLLRLHDQVIRVMKHLIREYDIDIEPIRNFNVRGVLSDLSYLNEVENENNEEEYENMNINKNENENLVGGKKSRKNKKSRKSRKSHKSSK